MKNSISILIFSSFLFLFQGEVSKAKKTSPEFSRDDTLDIAESFYHPFDPHKCGKNGRIGRNQQHTYFPLNELWAKNNDKLSLKNKQNLREEEANKFASSSTKENEGEKASVSTLSTKPTNLNESLMILSNEQKKLQLSHASNIFTSLINREYTFYAGIFTKYSEDPIFSNRYLDPLLSILWKEYFLYLKKNNSHFRPYLPIPLSFAHPEDQEKITSDRNISSKEQSQEIDFACEKERAERKPSLFERGQKLFTSFTHTIVSSIWF